MSGPPPKPPELRQRANKVSTAATLVGSPVRRAPSLPKDIQWHSATKIWWRHIWRSPMASQWLESDIDGLILLARFRNKLWGSLDERLAAEVRQQEARFGLAPLDRWRLQWKVEQETIKKTAPEQEDEQADDPRVLLKLVQ